MDEMNLATPQTLVAGEVAGMPAPVAQPPQTLGTGIKPQGLNINPIQFWKDIGKNVADAGSYSRGVETFVRDPINAQALTSMPPELVEKVATKTEDIADINANPAKAITYGAVHTTRLQQAYDDALRKREPGIDQDQFLNDFFEKNMQLKRNFAERAATDAYRFAFLSGRGPKAAADAAQSTYVEASKNIQGIQDEIFKTEYENNKTINNFVSGLETVMRNESREGRRAADGGRVPLGEQDRITLATRLQRIVKAKDVAGGRALLTEVEQLYGPKVAQYVRQAVPKPPLSEGEQKTVSALKEFGLGKFAREFEDTGMLSEEGAAALEKKRVQKLMGEKGVDQLTKELGDVTKYFGSEPGVFEAVSRIRAGTGNEADARLISQKLGAVEDRKIQLKGKEVGTEAQARADVDLAMKPKTEAAVAQATLPIKLQEAQAKANIEVATAGPKAAATERAKTTVEAEQLLPQQVAQGKQAVDSINSLLSNPAFKQGAVGLTGPLAKVVSSVIGGNRYADFTGQLEIIKSQQFLAGVAQMKGSGALSDAEGKKIEAATAALNVNMTPKEFERQLKIIRDTIQSGIDRTAAKANQPTTQLPRVAAPGSRPPLSSFQR